MARMVKTTASESWPIGAQEMASHTKGPWIHHSHRQVGPKDGIVCEVWSSVGVQSDDAIAQADANVSLISAAPDLLSALMELVDIVDDAISQKSAKDLDSFTLQPALAAIEKAKGFCHHTWECVNDGKHGREELWRCHQCGKLDTR